MGSSSIDRFRDSQVERRRPRCEHRWAFRECGCSRLTDVIWQHATAMLRPPTYNDMHPLLRSADARTRPSSRISRKTPRPPLPSAGLGFPLAAPPSRLDRPLTAEPSRRSELPRPATLMPSSPRRNRRSGRGGLSLPPARRVRPPDRPETPRAQVRPGRPRHAGSRQNHRRNPWAKCRR